MAVYSFLYEKWFGFNYYILAALRKKYYETKLKKCGTGLKIYGKPLLFKPWQISVGNYVTINNGVQIAPRGNVVIDDYVTFSRGSQIVAGQLDTSKFYGGV